MLKIRHGICPIILPVVMMTLSCHNNPDKPANSPAADSVAPATGNVAPANATSGATTSDGTKTIIFFGNSLTAGYGLRPDEAFTALIGRRLDSLHLPYKAVNAGVSGETSAGGLTRVGWVLRQRVDIFVLELGGNDGLRGIPLNSTRDNLQGIIDTVRKRYPAAKIVLAGMQIPPNMGDTYARQFRDLFPGLAKRNSLTLIPFLLKDVGGNPALNQGDGIHPNVAGEKIVTETVWKTLQPLL